MPNALRIVQATARCATRAALLASLALLTACESAATGQQDWFGTYVYEANAGETDGVAAVVEYKLEVGNGTCQVTVQGFQSDEAIVCTETHDTNQLTVRFKQYQNGQLVNAFGTQVYQPNETLFSLVRASNSPLTTRWGTLKPDDADAASGVFFKKTG